MAELNPAMRAFVESLGAERIWAEVLIEREREGFGLRHVADRAVAPERLRRVAIGELRKIATFDAAGDFRPLRAAPDLVKGWVCHCKTAEELWRALQDLYPGSIPDWYAAREGAPPVTNYREFTNRQSGMYRITQSLSDAQAAQVIRACCPARFCLKRRFWTVEGLAPDAGEMKSEIPCLEPCAILLELARKAARIEQEEKGLVQIAPSELESFVSAVKMALENEKRTVRSGNIGSPANPRRLQLALEKYGAAVKGGRDREED